jgi:hypothetical protein
MMLESDYEWLVYEGKICKGTVVEYFEVLPSYSPRDTEKTHENPQ